MEATEVLCVTQPRCNRFRDHTALSRHCKIRLHSFWLFLAQTLANRFLSCRSQFRYSKSEYVGSVTLTLRKYPVIHVLTTDLPPLSHTTTKVFVPLHLLSSSVFFLKCTREAVMKKRQDSFKLMLSLLSPKWEYSL